MRCRITLRQSDLRSIRPTATVKKVYPMSSPPTISPQELHSLLLGEGELALLDLREQGAFGESHILYAACLPLSRLELRVGRLVPRRSVPVVLCDGGEGLAERGAAQARGPRLPGRAGARGRDAGLGGSRLHRLLRHQRAEQGVRRVHRARVRHPLGLRRGAEGDDGRGGADRRPRQPADGRVPGDEHPGRGVLPRGGARPPGGRRRPGPRNAGGRQLRGPHPEHHRRPVPHQRGGPEPGDRPSQRHDGLAPRGIRARARPGRSSAPPRGSLARGLGAGGGAARRPLRGRVRGCRDPCRLAA